MAFHIHMTDDGHVPGIEYLPAGTITPKAGMMLTQMNGKLAAATGTSKPSYMSMCEREEACADGEVIPVLRVEAGVMFETTWSAEASAVTAGSKVTLSADGMQVTATTTNGVAEVVSMDGTLAGGKVRVRFA